MPESDNADNESSRSQTNGEASSSNANSTPGVGTGAGAGAEALRGWDNVIPHISNHKIDFILAITRTFTVLCTLSYLIGYPGPASNRYKQALLMNTATYSLRLHQRMPPPPLSQLNRHYFMNLIQEDSFHYLIYPFMFFSGQPLTLVLWPCAFYALFNLAVYSITILDKMGNQESLKQQVSNFVHKYQQTILITIALAEIVLMLIAIIGVFTKVVSIFVPLLYYRFLMLRYNSTRNPHLKLLITKIRIIATTHASRFYTHR